MNKFKQSSLVERNKMTALFNMYGITNFSFTDEDSYERFDGEFTNLKNEEIIFEVKVRNIKSNAYRTTIIEKSKYDFLLSQDKISYLFIFFNDNSYFIHKLDKNNNYNMVKRNAPKTTAGNNEMVQKEFVEIYIDKVQFLTTN